MKCEDTRWCITLAWAEAAELIRRTQGTPVLLSFPRMRRTGYVLLLFLKLSHETNIYISHYDEGYLLPRGTPVSEEKACWLFEADLG